MSRIYSTSWTWEASSEDSGVRFEIDKGLRIVAIQTDYSTKLEEQVESTLIHLNDREISRLKEFLSVYEGQNCE